MPKPDHSPPLIPQAAGSSFGLPALENLREGLAVLRSLLSGKYAAAQFCDIYAKEINLSLSLDGDKVRVIFIDPCPEVRVKVGFLGKTGKLTEATINDKTLRLSLQGLMDIDLDIVS